MSQTTKATMNKGKKSFTKTLAEQQPLTTNQMKKSLTPINQRKTYTRSDSPPIPSTISESQQEASQSLTTT